MITHSLQAHLRFSDGLNDLSREVPRLPLSGPCRQVLSPPRLYRRMPSLLEYLSYNCNFMGILAGPTCSYNDYKAFIEGTGFQPRHQENANGKENGKCKQSEPSPKVRLSFVYS